MEWSSVQLKKIGSNRYELLEEVVVKYENITIRIPKGFKTNGADIPRVLWSIFPPFSPEYIEPVVIHDYLCELAHKDNDFRFADSLFKEALLASGINKLKVYSFYLGVRSYHKTIETLKGGEK